MTADDINDLEDENTAKRKKKCTSCMKWLQVDPENALMEKKLGMKINNISLYNYMHQLDASQERILYLEKSLEQMGELVDEKTQYIEELIKKAEAKQNKQDN